MPNRAPDIRDKLRTAVRTAVFNTYGLAVNAAAQIHGKLDCNPRVKWLLIATFPNGGSTAVANLLAQSAHTTTLTPSGEGQWLVPQMSAPGTRWNPRQHVDYDRMRRVWLSRVPSGEKPVIVVEKSPPNLCRLPDIASALAPMDVGIIRMTRDPLATCASWFKRYSREAIIRSWAPEFCGKIKTEADHFKMLSDIYAERARMMVSLNRFAPVSLKYEDFTETTETLVDAVQNLFPELDDIEKNAIVKVKDYKPQKLRNMNAEQIATLSKKQLHWLLDGLAPHHDIISQMGYDIAPPAMTHSEANP